MKNKTARDMIINTYMNNTKDSITLFKCPYCKCFNKNAIIHLQNNNNCFKKLNNSRYKLFNKYDIIEAISGDVNIKIINNYKEEAKYTATNIIKELNKTDINKKNKYYIITKQISKSSH